MPLLLQLAKPQPRFDDFKCIITSFIISYVQPQVIAPRRPPPANMPALVKQLKEMFPSVANAELESVLLANDGSVEDSVNSLLSAV